MGPWGKHQGGDLASLRPPLGAPVGGRLWAEGTRAAVSVFLQPGAQPESPGPFLSAPIPRHPLFREPWDHPLWGKRPVLAVP